MTDRFDPARTALLLIDFQKDFLDERGRMPVASGQVAGVISSALKAIAEVRKQGMLVVRIANAFSRNDRLMNILRRHAAIEGSEGAAWDSRLPADDAHLIFKQRADAFSNPELEALLRGRGVSQVVLTGLMARACVSATARGALERGLGVTALAPAIACASDGSRARALRRLSRDHVRVVEALDLDDAKFGRLV